MFFNNISKGNAILPRHIPFIVHYNLKIFNIHRILIKLENSYVSDK